MFCKERSEETFSEFSDIFALLNFGAFEEKSWHKLRDSLGASVSHIYAQITSPYDMLPGLRGTDIFPNDLARTGLNPIESDMSSFLSGFHVVVGNSILDYIYAWNRDILVRMPSPRDTLWIPEHLVDSETFISRLGEWIDGNFDCISKTPDNRVVSYCADESVLKYLAERLTACTKLEFQGTKMDGKYFYAIGMPPFPSCSQTTKEAVTIPRKFGQFTAPYPMHALPSRSSNIEWMIDIELHSQESNLVSKFKGSRWHLPQRHGIQHKFVYGPTPSRIDRNGHISVEISSNSRSLCIQNPTQRELFHPLLNEGTIVENSVTEKSKSISHFSVSRPGEALLSSFQLFGSIDELSTTFQSDCWRELIFRFVAPSHRQLAEKLKEKLLADIGTNEIRIEYSKIIDFSREIATLARRETKPAISVSLREIRAIMAKFAKSKDEATHLFCRVLPKYTKRGIFLNGSYLECEHCSSKNWYSIESVNSNIRCLSCLESFDLDPHFTWSGRLNGVLLSALEDFDLSTEIQTVCALAQQSTEHFVFLPSQNFYDSDNLHNACAEVDILIIADSQYILVEAKSSNAELDKPEKLMRFVKLVEKLCPDIAILSVPSEYKDTEEVSKAMDYLKTSLNSFPVRVDLLPVSWDFSKAPRVIYDINAGTVDISTNS